MHVAGSPAADAAAGRDSEHGSPCALRAAQELQFIHQHLVMGSEGLCQPHVLWQATC